MFPDQAPKTVRNFVELAEGSRSGHPATREKVTKPLFEGTVFHRVIPGFMQGGDPLGTGRGGPGYTFADEFHPDLSFDRPYLLAMANAGPGTNGSQFFITVAPTAWLNRKHTIFGEVADQGSRDVVDEIASVRTAGRPAGRRRGDRDDRRLAAHGLTGSESGTPGLRTFSLHIMATADSPDPTASVVPTCYRHPDRETYVRALQSSDLPRLHAHCVSRLPLPGVRRRGCAHAAYCAHGVRRGGPDPGCGGHDDADRAVRGRVHCRHHRAR